MRISQIYSEISKDHHSLGKIMLKVSQFNCMLFLMISFQHNAFTSFTSWLFNVCEFCELTPHS